MRKFYSYETPTYGYTMANKCQFLAIKRLPPWRFVVLLALAWLLVGCGTLNVTDLEIEQPVTIAETEADPAVLEVMGYE